MTAPISILATQAASEEDRQRRLRDVVAEALHATNSFPGVERRATERYPYPYAIHLTPVEPTTRRPVGATRAVLGKHISHEGFGFVSFEPFHFRFAIVSLEIEPGRYAGLLGEALWCKFSRHGWYETGGRVIEVVPSPLDAAA